MRLNVLRAKLRRALVQEAGSLLRVLRIADVIALRTKWPYCFAILRAWSAVAQADDSISEERVDEELTNMQA